MFMDEKDTPQEGVPDDQDPDLLQTVIPRAAQSGPQPTNIAEFVQAGLRFQRKQEYDQALEAYQQALVLAKHQENTTSASQVANMIGSLYEMIGENPQAIEYYQQTLEIVLADNFLLATHFDGEPLTPDHGYPLRGVLGKIVGRDDLKTPYFWKGAKWLRGLEFMSQDRYGFWE